jgi:hypothetical protein
VSFRHTKKKKNFTTEDTEGTEGTEKNNKNLGSTTTARRKQKTSHHQGSKAPRETARTWVQQQRQKHLTAKDAKFAKEHSANLGSTTTARRRWEPRTCPPKSRRRRMNADEEEANRFYHQGTKSANGV